MSTWYFVDSEANVLTADVFKSDDKSIWFFGPDGSTQRHGKSSFGGRWTPNYDEAVGWVQERVADARKTLEKREKRLKDLLLKQPQ